MRKSQLSQHRVFVATAICLCTAVGVAQTSEKTSAVTLFDEAQKLIATGNFTEACPKFAESYRLDPQLGALLHLADCYENTGQLASAWTAFRDAAELADRRADERSMTARQRATTIEARLSRLTITVPADSNVPGLQVKRDGIVVGTTLWGSPVPVDSGKHLVSATAPGKQAWEQIVDVGSAKQEMSLAVPRLANEVVEATASAPAVSTSGTTQPAPLDANSSGPQASWTKPFGWAAVGLGAVGIGIGIAFQVKRSSKIDDRNGICPTGQNCTSQDQMDINRLTDEARSAGTVSVASLLTGSVLAAGGLALLFVLPAATTSGKTNVQPAVGLGYQGVNVTHVW